MSCNKPLYRLPIIPEGLPRDMRHRVKHGALICNQKERDDLIKYWKKTEDMFQTIGCGQCSACRLDYSRQWAIRCCLEANYYKFNWFITLTYDDKHLPKGRILDLETGEIEFNCKGEERAVLEEKDMKDFLKRLRMSAERKGLRCEDLDDCRYFYCGEYGETYQRPHYHMLSFGLEIPDLEPAYVRDGYRFFYSSWIEKLWGKGFVVIGEFCFDTAAYVARYVMKKQKGKGAKELKAKKRKVIIPQGLSDMFQEEYRDEFCRMSRRPGIGKRYFDEHKDDIYATDSLYIKCSNGLNTVKPPSYFDNLYDIENHEELEKIKAQRRKVAKARQKLKMAQTSLSEIEYREMLENKKLEQIKKLKREVE